MEVHVKNVEVKGQEVFKDNQYYATVGNTFDVSFAVKDFKKEPICNFVGNISFSTEFCRDMSIGDFETLLEEKFNNGMFQAK